MNLVNTAVHEIHRAYENYQINPTKSDKVFRRLKAPAAWCMSTGGGEVVAKKGRYYYYYYCSGRVRIERLEGRGKGTNIIRIAAARGEGVRSDIQRRRLKCNLLFPSSRAFRGHTFERETYWRILCYFTYVCVCVLSERDRRAGGRFQRPFSAR